MLIASVQWIAQDHIGGWAVDTGGPSDIRVTLNRCDCDIVSTITSICKGNIPPPFGAKAGFVLPISSETYRAILMEACDNIRDVGLYAESGANRIPILLKSDLIKALQGFARKTDFFKFEINSIVSTREDGRIYLRGGSNKNYELLTDKMQWQPETAEYWSGNIKKLMQETEKNGGKFLFVVIAAKEVIEYAGPDFEVSANRPVHKLYKMLDEKTKSCFYYNLYDLITKSPSERKFISNDTHLNALGAFVTAAGIQYRLGIIQPNLSSVHQVDFFMGMHDGDLARNVSGSQQRPSLQFNRLSPILNTEDSWSTGNIFGMKKHLLVRGHSTGKMLFFYMEPSYNSSRHVGSFFANDIGNCGQDVVVIVPERYLARGIDVTYLA